MPEGDLIFGTIITIVLLLVFILINAFFAMGETALLSVNDTKLKKLAEDGDKKAKRVLKLKQNSSEFFSVSQIGMTLTAYLISAVAAGQFNEPMANQIASWFNIDHYSAAFGFIEGVALISLTIIISYFALVLGELIPRKIGIKKEGAVSLKIGGMLTFSRAIFSPFVKILTVSANLILRIFGVDPKDDVAEVTEEEILLMVDESADSGVIEESQKDMITAVFEFSDIVAGDVMTHRTSVEAVEVNTPIEDALKEIVKNAYSRIPVYKEDIDNIVGALYIKDLLPYVGKQIPKSVTVKSVMRDVYLVPESKTCDDLFREMCEQHKQMAIVVDEYGGTAGIVTIEDLLESIVGNMQDEYDDEQEDVEVIDENTFNFDGTTTIDEVNEVLNITLPEGEYDTLGGLIMATIGKVPDEETQESIEISDFIFTIEKVEDRRIDRIKVERTTPAKKEEEVNLNE